jgi:hypothetical protein
MFLLWYALLYLAMTVLICGLIKLQKGCSLLATYLKKLFRLQRALGTVTSISADLHFSFDYETQGVRRNGRTESLAREFGFSDESFFGVDVIGKMLRYGHQVGKTAIVYVDHDKPGIGFVTRTLPRQIVQCLLIGIVLFWVSAWMLTLLF